MYDDINYGYIYEGANQYQNCISNNIYIALISQIICRYLYQEATLIFEFACLSFKTGYSSLVNALIVVAAFHDSKVVL